MGLDFETTGTDPWGDPPAAPIQLGIYVPSADLRMEYLIGGWDWKVYEWNEVSESIHGFTRAEIDKAEPVWKVDIRMAAQLLDVLGGRMFNVPVGWNVGSFDRQFITRHMPLLNRLLSYRSLDLNSAIFAVAKDEKEFNAIKNASKQYAEAKMKEEGDTVRWHHALTDAVASIHSLEYIRSKYGDPTQAAQSLGN